MIRCISPYATPFVSYPHTYTHSGPHAHALLWTDGEDASDPCRHFYLQACAFLGNVVTCNDYVMDDDEEEEEEGQGQEGHHHHGHHHISFAGEWVGRVVLP